MSAHHIWAGAGPKVWLFAIKVVRELGSERRETVRSLSTMGVEELRGLSLVREDRDEHTTGGPVVAPAAVPGS